MRVDRVHERVVDQSVDVTLPHKEELSVDIPVLPGMEDIVQAVRRLRPFERVPLCTVERMVDLPLLPESAVEVARFSPCERVQQQGVLQPPEETVKSVRSISCERVQQQVVECMVDKSIPQSREERCRGS